MKNINIYLFLILLNILLIPTLYDGLIDDFAPKHMATIHENGQRGFLTEGAKKFFPGFIVLGVIITQIVGIRAGDLLFFPIQWAPYLFITFCLFYKISNSHILSFILATAVLFSATSGTASIFFWPHGIGNILFYTFLILILSASDRSKLDSNNNIKNNIKLSLIVVGIALIYISYNLSAKVFIFILSFIVFNYAIILFSKYDDNITNASRRLIKIFLSLSVIFIVTQLGLFNFVYNVFLPTLESSRYLEFSVMDKFLISVPSIEVAQSNMSDVLIVKPPSLFFIGVIKHLTFLISISVSSAIIYNKIKYSVDLKSYDSFLIYIIITELIYGLIRIPLGSGAILISMTFPGLISLLWLYQHSEYTKKWSYLLCIIFIISNIVYYYECLDNDLLNKDPSKFAAIYPPSLWLNKHHASPMAIASDELTKNIFIMHLVIEQNRSYSDLDNMVKMLSHRNILFLLNKNPEIKPVNRYYLINYNLNRLAIIKWTYIKSWKQSKSVIESNADFCSIYEAKDIKIYFPI